MRLAPNRSARRLMSDSANRVEERNFDVSNQSNKASMSSVSSA
jgi:hypothetical protein